MMLNQIQVALDVSRIIRRRSDEDLPEKSTRMLILDPMRPDESIWIGREIKSRGDTNAGENL